MAQEWKETKAKPLFATKAKELRAYAIATAVVFPVVIALYLVTALFLLSVGVWGWVVWPWFGVFVLRYLGRIAKVRGTLVNKWARKSGTVVVNVAPSHDAEAIGEAAIAALAKQYAV